MNQELKIEHYLLQLDRQLSGLSVSQRAEIVTEIKSHIRESAEKDPQRSVDNVLADLGTPRQVAERYLAAKGVPYMPPKRGGGQWFKWLALTTVALFAMVFLSGLALVWYLSPLLSIDSERGRVVLLGGMIDVDEKLGQVKVGNMVINDAFRDGVQVAGEQDLSGQDVTLIKIPFNTAKLAIQTSPDSRLSWNCMATGPEQPEVDVDAGVLTLNLDAINLAKCAILLPRGPKTEIDGVNGDLEIKNPQDGLDISLDNGKVEIEPDPSRVYDFEVNVKNGVQDTFPRSSSKEAVSVKVDVVNGMVKNE